MTVWGITVSGKKKTNTSLGLVIFTESNPYLKDV
jgi:hypothetical protein